jgi:hypothetical protein
MLFTISNLRELSGLEMVNYFRKRRIGIRLIDLKFQITIINIRIILEILTLLNDILD